MKYAISMAILLISYIAVQAQTPPSDSEVDQAHKICADTETTVVLPSDPRITKPLAAGQAPLTYKPEYAFCKDIEAGWLNRHSAAAKEVARKAAAAIADKLKN